MMSTRHKHIDWLLRELPELLAQGVVNQETATVLTEHYQQEKSKQKNMVLAIFGVLGAVLIGAGIILLLAYNWSILPRILRTLISLGLLGGAQALVAWSVLKRFDSLAWREGSAIFLTLSLGASIALVGQTYHIPGDLPPFLLSWMLLALPLVYVIRVNLPAILYYLGLMTWFLVLLEREPHAPEIAFWLLFILPVPWLIGRLRQHRDDITTIYLGLMVSLTFIVGAIASLVDSLLEDYWILCLSLIFAVVYLLWQSVYQEVSHWQEKALSALGAAGLLIMVYASSMAFFWDDVVSFKRHVPLDFAPTHVLYAVDFLLLIALPLLWVGLWLLHYQRKNLAALSVGGLPFIFMLGYILRLYGHEILVLILMNLVILALGVMILTEGIQQRSPGQLSFGLLLIAVLIFIRFVDAEMPLLARGFAFIVVGIAFLLANLTILRFLKNQETRHE